MKHAAISNFDPQDSVHAAENSTVKLCDFVYAKIAGRIRSGEYPINSRLPPETELAEMLGVSRPVVREALARLRNDGFVLSRRGSGTYVQKQARPPQQAGVTLSSISDMRRCFEFRIGLEAEAAYHAAKGHIDDRAGLIDAMAQLEADFQASTFEEHDDFAFHNAISEATGNRFFVQTLEALRSSIVTIMALTPNFLSAQPKLRLELTHNEHRAIFDAIMDNDPDRAKAAMRAHLTGSMRRIFEGEGIV